MNLTMNTDAFIKNLNSLGIEEKIKKALFKTGVEIIANSEHLIPIDEGTLVGSNSVSVTGKGSVHVPMSDEKIGGSEPNTSGMNDLELRIGYNTEYALKLHETDGLMPGAGSQQKGLQGSGAFYKYLTRTMDSMDLKKIFSEFLRDEFE
ncbi:MAG: HK97 gp10 family phage protein [Leptospiraceae bacterium]|nr:HK97 gp10 family phage protein [Leptospiraceae bacterium]